MDTATQTLGAYLSYQFYDTPESVSTFDELPLWSASFGLFMLKHLQFKKGITVADAGSGTGFPLLELAARLGSSCKLYGIDPWSNANERAKQKIKNYGLSNVEIIEGSAEKMPFEDGSIDLIVSNLGINNFETPGIVFKECYRVLKPGGKLALTTNLNGHWQTFYNIFEETLVAMGEQQLVPGLHKQQQHRGSVDSISSLFTNSNFKTLRHAEDSFEMNFSDGSAFLNHHFIKLGWLSSWKSLLPPEKMESIFSALEENLNRHASAAGMLSLSVPMAFIEGEK